MTSLPSDVLGLGKVSFHLVEYFRFEQILRGRGSFTLPPPFSDESNVHQKAREE